MRSIQRLLIANRGEIACRIMRTAAALGIDTVAVHSEADAQALHVLQADQAVNLGGSKPEESYLHIHNIIEAALNTGADAIHPGYGFLAENPSFARAVHAAGLCFVGPSADAMEAMGSKSAAKALMEQAKVPLVPGYHGEEQTLARFQQEVEAIGYPVLLKASAGGGGRGMQVVEEPNQLEEALASAKREAKAAFGDDHMLVEKYLLSPRHVEVQIFADEQGNCIYLQERDCSIQRRHQKIIEEAPAPGLSSELRRTMGEAAVRAAHAVNYVGAGTVEFLLDSRGHFYFMEMNTRLQVEHPITELITGTDLVAWQLQVAQGQPLPLAQEEVPLHGHAMEVRLYAEDPEQDFLPMAGTLELYREPPTSATQRVDSGVREGDIISPFYDPMVTKLIAWGETREQARRRLLAMLDNTHIAGIATNIPFLKRTLIHPAFAAGQVHTGFIEEHQQQLLGVESELTDTFWQLAGAAWLHSLPHDASATDPYSPWANTQGWRNGAAPSSQLRFELKNAIHTVTVSAEALANTVWQNHELSYQHHGKRQQLSAIRQHGHLHLQWGHELYTLALADPIAHARADDTQGGLTAPMNGSIVNVAVNIGQTVAAGDLLVVVEAMKMEHSIRAPYAGTVSAISARAGDLVSEGAVLVELEAES